MDLLARVARAVERRLGNTGLVALAGLVFFAAVTGAAVQSHSTSKSAESALSTTSTTARFESSTTLGSSTTLVAPTTTSTSTSTTVLTTTTAAGSRTGLAGYSAVAFTVTPRSKAPAKACGLLAASSDQQAQGLMNRNDLGGYDAMIFPFQTDTDDAFYMANVPVALSVAWFDKNGKFVSSADMPVCTVAAAKCPLYKASGAYRTAIETLKGGLGALGVGSGSVISIGAAGPC